MMGRDHALSGVMVGLGTATLARAFGEPLGIVHTLVLVAVTAGAALWPDLDHPSATAARAFGPVSRLMAVGLDRAGALIYAITSTRRDQPTEDGHRTITHTLVFALISGAVTAGICTAWPTWGTLAVMWVMLSLALRGMLGRWTRSTDWLTVSFTAAALTGAAWLATDGGIPAGLLGLCVALGSYTHCLGDSCTMYGCPWLWPVPIRGRVWYRIGTPRWMRFRTGTEETDGEDYLRAAMWVTVVVLAVAQVPGGWSWLGDATSRAWEWATAG